MVKNILHQAHYRIPNLARALTILRGNTDINFCMNHRNASMITAWIRLAASNHTLYYV